jgi:hypothetical protein
MKFIILAFLFMNLAIASEQNPKVGSPSSGVSRGSADNSGLSNGTIGPNDQEKQEMREKNESLGGAPNAGVGTGTGTGSGSTLGKKIKTNDE